MRQLAVSIALFAAGVASAAEPPSLEQLQKMEARFARVELSADLSHLAPGDRQALASLVQASRLLNGVFLDQMWKGNAALHQSLKQDQTPLGKARLGFFWLNKGPWSELDDWAAFIPGVPARKPLGANFYPEDATREQLEAWFNQLEPAAKAQATGFFSVIRRGDGGALRTVPYSEEYAGALEKAAALLRKAAGETPNATLKNFLLTRADALKSNDYYESDVAWMDLDAPVELTYGPYETYLDELFNYKASFEAYVTLRDEKESTRLAALSKQLQAIENALPVEAQYRNPNLGAASPIRAVDLVYAAGDADHGVVAAAYNLPNDERVVQKKGSKRVLLRNVQQAKFKSVLVPISKQVLGKADQGAVDFDVFFLHVLAHELAHGLGLHQIKVGGRDTSPRAELTDLYGPIEEARADILSLYMLRFLSERSAKLGLTAVVPPGEAFERRLYATYLASSFRTLRFGLSEAHGRSMALQFNTLLDKGAFKVAKDGTFSVDLAKMRAAVKDLSHDLIMVTATGNRAEAERLLKTLSVMRPETQKAIDELASLPTDIDPQFVTAEKLAPETP